MTIINEYTNYVNTLINDFGFGKVLDDIANYRDWLCQFRDSLLDAGYHINSGACRAVIFHDDWDYVIKFGKSDDQMYDEDGNTLGTMDYCANEEFLYREATKLGLADYFAECLFLGEFGEDQVKLYLMTRCECDADRVSSGSYEAAFRVYCEENGYDHEHASDDVYEEFSDYYCEDDDDIFEFAREQWGSIVEQVKDFCYKMGINDTHCGNWGFISDRLVLIDYAGYGCGARCIAAHRGIVYDECY